MMASQVDRLQPQAGSRAGVRQSVHDLQALNRATLKGSWHNRQCARRSQALDRQRLPTRGMMAR